MARIRSLKPDFWTSAQVMACSIPARLLFVGIWTFADDKGRIKNDPRMLKAQIMPGDDISTHQVVLWLDELEHEGLLLSYEVDGQGYLWVTGWRHQKIDRPQPPKHPGPPPELLAKFFEQTAEGKRFDGRSSIRRMTNKNPVPHSTTDRIGSEGRGSERIGPDIPKSKNSSAAGAAVKAGNGLAGKEGSRDGPDNALARTTLFNSGLADLEKLTNRGALGCRGLVGKWLKTLGDDKAWVLLAIVTRAKAKAPMADPVAWIEKAVRITTGTTTLDVAEIIKLVEFSENNTGGPTT